MKNRVPGHERPCVLRKLESRKEYTRSKNNDPVEDSFQNPGNPFIELTKKNKANPKTKRHQHCQKINTDGQAWAVKLETPGEIPDQPKNPKRNR